MSTDETICIVLPKGDVMAPLNKLFHDIKFPISHYNSQNRTYRPQIDNLPVQAKIMAEKDIALQVAVNNYDVGFCSKTWIEEHSTKYKATNLHIFRQLQIEKRSVYCCCSASSNEQSINDFTKRKGYVTLVSEYPNLAKTFAIKCKLKKFKIFSAWGSVEAYPPEHADLVVISASNKKLIEDAGLKKFLTQHFV